MSTQCLSGLRATPLWRAWVVSSCLVFAILLAVPASAQVLYGSIVGNVTDTSSAALPGATVTITNLETGAVREAVTDAAGAYTVPTSQPGRYRVAVSLAGFATATQPDVVVSLNTVTRVNIGLRLGALEETITVEATSPLLQTDRAEVRQELDTRQLRDLPVPLGRNYQNLFGTLPGFSPPADAHSVPSNPSRALTFNVNGASRSSNNTRIDGVSTTNIWLPHVVAYVPALESLETVNVVTGSFDAEQGLAGGAAINVQIKSGTNQLRGSAFEYHTNEKLRALEWFAPPGTDKGEWRYNQFGGTVGGPILKNKLFYFASYEGTRDKQNVSRVLSVPTAALRRGDFSAAPNPIYDPATGNIDGTGRSPFPGNQIPANRINPISARLLSELPLPNLTDADGSVPEQNNYFAQAPFIFNRWTLDTKVNLNATQNMNFFGRYSVLDFTQDNAVAFGDFLQGPPIGGGNPGVGFGKTHNVSGGMTYTLTPSMVFDANVGWVRMGANVAQNDIDQNKGLDVLGIPGTNGTRDFEGGMPRFTMTGYTGMGTTEGYMPYYRNDDQIQAVVNLNWVKGRHNIRMGSDVYWQAMNHTQPEFIGTSMGARGGFDFQSGPTLLRGGPGGNNFNGMATFLLGLPTTIGKVNEVEAPYTTRNIAYSMYIRDQWQVNSRMTLSFGTRWEYFPMPTRANRGLERYNPETNRMEIGGVGSVPEDLGVKMSKTLFAPRLGGTFRLDDRSVIRAGYGLTNDPFALARPMRTNHPILLNLIVQAPTSFGWTGRIQDGIPTVSDPDLGNGIIEIPDTVAAFTVPAEFTRGYIHSWNAAFQRELGWGFVGEVAYVGNKQVNQLGYRELNWSPINGGQAGRQLAQQFGRTAQTRIVTPIGDSTYHALQTQLNRRFGNGFQLGVNYTYSQARGVAGAPNSDNVAHIQIPEYYHLNYGRSDVDRPHVFNFTNIVELPFGPGRRWLSEGGVLGAIVGGWQLNNVISVLSGTPFDVTASGASLNAPESGQRADLVGTPTVFGTGGAERGRRIAYFDPFAFRPVTEPRFGTAPFNVLYGPGYWRWDLGLFREVRFGGGRSLQFRFEGFNILDTPRFNNPGSNVSSLRLNPDGTVRDLNGFTEITGTAGGSQRQIRLGIRLGF